MVEMSHSAIADPTLRTEKVLGMSALVLLATIVILLFNNNGYERDSIVHCA